MQQKLTSLKDLKVLLPENYDLQGVKSPKQLMKMSIGKLRRYVADASLPIHEKAVEILAAKEEEYAKFAYFREAAEYCSHG